MNSCFFFFSSRRRHTRCLSDWSSDVCSSDLFRKIDADEVTFSTRDTKTKQVVETRYTMTEFVSTLVHHIPDRYRHNVRHFGLLAPRLKARSHDLIFRLLDQERLGKPKHLPWARSLGKHFGIDPLIDTNGQRMRWLRRVPPATTIRRTV